MTIAEYLQQHYTAGTAGTAASYGREIEIFLSGYPLAAIAVYCDLMAYVGQLRLRYSNAQMLNRIVCCIKAYYDYLCYTGKLVNLVQGRLSMKGEATKIDLAYQIIDHVTRTLKIGVKWVCFDAFYGRDAHLLGSLIKMGLSFVADVPDRLHIWLEPFQMRVPVRKPGSSGRPNVLAKPNRESISIHNYVSTLKKKDWQWIKVRHQNKDRRLFAWFHSREVYIYNPVTQRRQLTHLLIRKDIDGTIKYSFCYHPAATLKQLAYMQCKRYFIEKAFREGKKELGLNQYQVRSEQSWHKHMAMVMLAQLFINTQKLHYYNDERLWFTTQDIILLIRSIFKMTLRTVTNLVMDILAKQPRDYPKLKKLLFIRI